MTSARVFRVADVDVAVGGIALRTARLADEYFVPLAQPGPVIAQLKSRGGAADIFSFVQDSHDNTPHFDHRLSWDQLAVLPLTTYDHWFDRQLTFKPRNRLRKAWKCGVDTRVVAFDDELVRGIMAIYNETPLRQGKHNWHYGKSFDTVRREHATFLDRSDFIGAYFAGELIGFAKVTHGEHGSIFMNIVAKVAHRDKATSNALLAGTVEVVTARHSPSLTYGVWGRRGLNTFKVINGFECRAVPRFHVPLTLRGELALRLNLHLGLKERLPEAWLDRLAHARSQWNEWRCRITSGWPTAQGPIAKARVGSDSDA